MRTKLKVGLVVAALALILPTNAAYAAPAPEPTPSGVSQDTAAEATEADTVTPMSGTYWTYWMVNKRLINDNYVNYKQKVGQCSDESGGQCSISQSASATRTADLTIGVTFKWVTANLSIPSSRTQTVSMQCTSPRLSATQVYRAYPSGDWRSYNVSKQQWGVAPGGMDYKIGGVQTSHTLFSFNPTGIHCRVES